MRLHNTKTIITTDPVSHSRMKTNCRVRNQHIAIRFRINRTICAGIRQTQIGLRKPSNQSAGFIKRIIRTIRCHTDRRPVTVCPPGSPCISLTRRNIPMEIAGQTIEIFVVISLRFRAHTLTEPFRILRQILTGLHLVITVQFFSGRITNPPVLNRNNGRTINLSRIRRNTRRTTIRLTTQIIPISRRRVRICNIHIRPGGIHRIIICTVTVIGRTTGALINHTDHAGVHISRNIFRNSNCSTIRNAAKCNHFSTTAICQMIHLLICHRGLNRSSTTGHRSRKHRRPSRRCGLC